jgi:hypothetical protein
MSSMPPDQPTEPSATPPPPPPPEPPLGGTTIVGGSVSGGEPPRTQINVTDIARLPMPGNAEFALWLFLEVCFTLIWWIDDDVDVSQWMTITTALTFAYFISRGIAKASRVLEQ